MVGFALMLIIPASLRMWLGSFTYSNYWGGRIFTPVGLVVGVLILVIALFRPRVFQRQEPFHGKAARRAKRAERSRPAVETFHKPWSGGSRDASQFLIRGFEFGG